MVPLFYLLLLSYHYSSRITNASNSNLFNAYQDDIHLGSTVMESKFDKLFCLIPDIFYFGVLIHPYMKEMGLDNQLNALNGDLDDKIMHQHSTTKFYFNILFNEYSTKFDSRLQAPIQPRSSPSKT